ncbi:MAG TPA: amidohydrolase family protein [Caldilineaceae bacterium]|nr:amidohydrolase family protein [Caldilineaceae bacterium]
MIIDSHCHAWRRWPYTPEVPDPDSRGRIEQLLFEMDQHGVDRAVLVCARIDHNPDNNEYIAAEVRRRPDRLVQFADVDCRWWPTYHTPGAAGRLAAAADSLPIAGFTHYLDDEDDGSWLYSDEGLAFFRVAAERGLIASISCRPHHQPALRKVAAAFPSLPILVHHMGLVRFDEGRPPQGNLQEVLASAALPNIYLKLSGFAYAAQVKWDYPYSDTLWMVRTLYEHFGAHRMCWGSDYPVVRQFMTYRQSLEAFRTHCAFVPEADKEWILGKTLARLLEQRQHR